MTLFRVTNNVASSRLNITKEQEFRPGQILQGRIVKLFPDQKADIQLGNQRMIAHLEVGLKVGGDYHFQVKSTGDIVNLKVLGEQSQAESNMAPGRLLKQLGVKQSQANMHLVNKLFQAQLPFDRTQIQQATQLLNNTKEKGPATDVLIEMFAKKLPIKSSVFDALLIRRNTSLNEEIQTVLRQFNQTLPLSSFTSKDQSEMEIQLRYLLTNMVQRPESSPVVLTKEIMLQNESNRSGFFRMLQGMGHVPLNLNFSEWKETWSNFSENRNMSTININTPLPYAINASNVLNDLTKLGEQKSQFNNSIQNWINQWGKELQFFAATGGKMDEDNFSNMLKNLTGALEASFSSGRQVSLQTMSNTPQNLNNLQAIVKALHNEQVITKFINLAEMQVSNEKFLGLNTKEQFLQQLHNYVHHVGIHYENQILSSKNRIDVQNTIKGLLLELISKSDGPRVVQQQKLVQLINSVQLQSVNESQSVIQANLQIPVERLGMINDLELEFQGRKDRDGKIDSDYCRILFHLELSFLKETIIDMNIQNRAISITIYNNFSTLERYAPALKEKLATNLEKLNYSLSQVKYKPIEEKKKPQAHTDWNKSNENQQGVDFRI